MQLYVFLLILLLLLISLPLNCLLLLALLRTPYLSTHPSALLLVALAIADIYVTAVSIPLALVALRTGVLGGTVCRAMGVLDSAASGVALWCVCFIALDRLLAVWRPIVYRRMVRYSRLKVLVGVLGGGSVVTSIPLLWDRTRNITCGIVLVNNATNNLSSNSTEPIELVHDYSMFMFRYMMLYESVHTVLPLFLTLLAYAGIFLAAGSLRARESARKRVLLEIRANCTSTQPEQQVYVSEYSISESGIETGTEGDEGEQPTRRSSASSARKSVVVSLDGRVTLSNSALFMDSLSRHFFTSTLIEDLNKLHEDYFSLSQQEPDEDEPECAFEDEVERTSDSPLVLGPRPVVRKRSRTEVLQIKTGVLLGAVVVVIVGSHIPILISKLTDTPTSDVALLLSFLCYPTNPALFGFLNDALRLAARNALVSLCARPVQLEQQTAGDSYSSVKRNSIAALKRFGRRISHVSLLRRGAEIVPAQMNIVGASDMSILSQRSLLKDHMTLRYFETNL